MVVRGGTLLSAIACVVLGVGGGCTNGEGNEPNVLPEEMVPSSGSTTTTDPTLPTDPTMSLETETDGETGPQTVFPATYRFDCVDIQGVGDADGTAFQAQVLENTWTADIAAFKLNILLEVESRDAESGVAMLGIRSGVGPSAEGSCTQPDTISELIEVPYVESQVNWEPTGASGECSQAASGTAGNTYSMQLGGEQVIYIYAEDDDTTPFNCTPDTGTPDAVPIRGVTAEVSTNAAETTISGTLTGCLLATEAMGLCSCLAECAGDGPDDLQADGECAGCPTGATPLSTLLGGVNPSANCTGLLGEDALDITLGFTATRLPDVPVSCG